MTKIKYSALVSGMSGKMQGTVMSRNLGGAYMRNNSSKVKPQTASNSVRKTLFSGTAQLWRNLTIEQQDSWRDAVINFPKTNWAGDVVYLSGYQLFMRLNSTRATIGYSPLETPPTPPTIPSFGETEINVSEDYQFIPNRAIANYVTPAGGAVQKINATAYNDGNSVLNNTFFAVRIDLSKTPITGSFISTAVTLFRINSNVAQGLRCYATRQPDGMLKLSVQVVGTGGSWLVVTDDAIVDPRTPFHVAVKMGSASIAGVKIYIDGIEADVTATPTGTLTPPTVSDGAWFGDFDLTKTVPMSFSDWRTLPSTATDADVLSVSRGYIIGTELSINGLYDFTTSDASLPYIGDEGAIVNLIPEVLVKLNGVATSPSLIPLMPLIIPNDGYEGLQINVYASPAISNGKSGNTSNWRLIASLSWVDAQTFELSSYWQERFKFWPVGATVNFRIEAFDTATGVISPASIKPKKPRRFKAGAELSGAVN